MKFSQPKKRLPMDYRKTWWRWS